MRSLLRTSGPGADTYHHHTAIGQVGPLTLHLRLLIIRRRSSSFITVCCRSHCSGLVFPATAFLFPRLPRIHPSTASPTRGVVLDNDKQTQSNTPSSPRRQLRSPLFLPTSQIKSLQLGTCCHIGPQRARPYGRKGSTPRHGRHAKSGRRPFSTISYEEP